MRMSDARMGMPGSGTEQRMTSQRLKCLVVRRPIDRDTRRRRSLRNPAQREAQGQHQDSRISQVRGLAHGS